MMRIGQTQLESHGILSPGMPVPIPNATLVDMPSTVIVQYSVTKPDNESDNVSLRAALSYASTRG